MFAVLATVTALVLALGSPAQAEPKKLLVSDSAAGPFNSQLGRPLFEGDGPFVPLDQSSTTFYVKNNSRQVARATVTVVNRGPTNEFEKALTLGLGIRGVAATGGVPAVGSPGCTLTVTGPSIQPGAVQAVDVSLAVTDLQQQVGTDQAASLDFVVRLTQTGRNGQVEVCGEQAGAQPEGQAQPAATGSTDCRRDVVVTATGRPTCVPTVVDAGTTYGGGDPRQPASVATIAVLLTAAGAGLLLVAGRRRRSA